MLSDAYSTGAPASACVDLVPGHYGAEFEDAEDCSIRVVPQPGTTTARGSL